MLFNIFRAVLAWRFVGENTNKRQTSKENYLLN
jgi:hypothetical protein